MSEMPKGRLVGDPAPSPGRKGRAKSELKIEFDPTADDPLPPPHPDPGAPDPAARAPRSSAPADDPWPQPTPGRRPGGPASGPAGEDAEAGPADPPAEAPGSTALGRRARQQAADAAARRLGLSPTLARLDVTVTVEIGRTRMTLSEIASVTPGELVALDRLTDEPVDVLVNGRLFARGEIVALGNAFGVRLTELAGDET